eukprot:gene33455-40474_t
MGIIDNFRSKLTITDADTEEVLGISSVDSQCTGLTQLQAAFYGYCPALILCVTRGTDSAAGRFNRIIRNDSKLTKTKKADIFADLVGELLTGKPCWPTQIPDDWQCHYHRRYYAFSIGTFDDKAKEFRLRWPLCYIRQIFDQDPPTPQGLSIQSGAIKDALDNLCVYANKEDTGTGLDWECIVHVALLIRCAHSVLMDAALPLELGRFPTSERHVKHIVMPSNITNMIQARDYICRTIVNGLHDKPTVMLFTPSASGLNTLDGFLVFSPGSVVLADAVRQGQAIFDTMRGTWILSVKVVGFQCKAGKKTPSKDAPKFVPKAFLLRGDPAAEKCSTTRGWEFYSREQILNLLGWSLAPFLPAEISSQIENDAKADHRL